MINARFKGSPDARLRRLAAYVPQANTEALGAVAQLGERYLKRQVGRVYERSIPRSKSGRPLWVRKGNLRRGTGQAKIVRRGNGYAATLGITGPAARYAQRRSELGYGWNPRKPAAGIVRRNRYIVNTQTMLEAQAGGVYQERFKRALEGK